MRRSVEIQPCSNRFVSIGSSFFHWGASISLSSRLRRSSDPGCGFVPHPSPIRGLCLLLSSGWGPRFYVRAFQDIDRYDFDRCLGFGSSAHPEVFGPCVISFHAAPNLCKTLVKLTSTCGNQERSTWGNQDDPKDGAKGDSNPRPLAPEARIIPLDHWPTPL